MVKNQSEIEKMRVAGKLAAEVLIMLGDFVKPGITTDEINVSNGIDTFVTPSKNLTIKKKNMESGLKI